MSTTAKRAKLFQTGHSQAVRLPREFRFSGTEVSIRREGHRVVLEPVSGGWTWLKELDQLGGLDDSALKAVRKKVPQQKRPALDKLFR